MEIWESNTSINITKDHTVLVFNEVILHILHYFVISFIFLVFVIYINHLLCRRLFDLFIFTILFLILLPPLLHCNLSSPYLDIKTTLP